MSDSVSMLTGGDVGLVGGNAVAIVTDGSVTLTGSIYLDVQVSLNRIEAQLAAHSEALARIEAGTFTQSDRDRLFSTALEATVQLIQTAIDGTSTKVDAVVAVLEIVKTKVNDVHDEVFGRWVIDFAANTMTLYRLDGSLLKVFSLVRSGQQSPNYVERLPQ